MSTASSLLDRPERRLLGLFIALSTIELVSEVVDSQIGQWATKPFLMPVLICLLIMSIGVEGNRLVVAALALSTLGDVFLLLDGDSAFMAGLIAFLCAQLCYIRAFASVGGVRAIRQRPVLSIPYGAYWLLLLAALWPDLGGLAAPVAIYGLALVTMAALALGVNRLTAVGAVFFVASDSLIAATSLTDRFDFPGAGLMVMPTYCLGQALIVLGWIAVRRAVPREAAG